MTRAIRFRDDIMSYGASLARKMRPEDRAAVLDLIDAGRVVGTAHVALTRCIIPNRMEVHFLPEGLTPDECIPSMAIALQRLMDLYGKPTTSPTVVASTDAERLLMIAGHLVDSIRQGTLSREGLLKRNFDLSRQDAVRDVFFALLTAPLSAAGLSRE